MYNASGLGPFCCVVRVVLHAPRQIAREISVACCRSHALLAGPCLKDTSTTTSHTGTDRRSTDVVAYLRNLSF